jgi:hypothetical protein
LLFKQDTVLASALAWLRAGRSKELRIAIMAITTRSSIRVNPRWIGTALMTAGSIKAISYQIA